MTAWPVVRLDEIAEVRLGRQRSPKNHIGDDMRPYLRAANVGWDGLRLEDVKKMNFTAGEFNTYRLEPGDLLLSEASGSRAEVGKPAIWQGEIADCAFQNTLLRVRPRKADPRFLLHYFRYLAATGGFADRSRGVGIFHLGRKALARLPTPLPPIDEQRRIAGVLDKAEAVRAQRLRSVRVLDELAHSTFEEILAGSHGHEHWKLLTVAQVGEVQGGLQVTTTRNDLPTKLPYLRVANVHRGSLDLREIKLLGVTAPELARTRLQAGDLLVVEGHGNAEEIGRAAVWDGSIDTCVHQNDLIRVRLDESRVLPYFAEAYLNSPHGRRHLLRAANTTSGLNTIGTRIVKEAPLAMPPMQLQRLFVDQVTRIRMVKERLMRHARELAALNASMQARAFRGEL